MTRGLQCVSVVAFLSMMTCGTVIAQSTAITYRGRLAQNGTPVSASADFEFSLWDAAGAGCPPVGGTQLGAVQTLTNVSVDEGLFTVLLNSAAEFGPNAFDGNARWIQIAVRSPAGSGQFVTLCPRQPITAVPYALFSFNAPGGGGGDTFWAASGANNIYNTNTGNVGIGTPNPTNRLSVAGNADVSGSFTAASFTGGGAGLTGLNANNLGSGTVPSARLSGTYSNALTFSNASNSFTGSGAGLTALNASNISTGTLANARTTGTAANTANTLVLRDASGNFSAGTITGTFSGNGSALTALNAGNISTGNLNSARMPTGGAWALTSALNTDGNTFVVDPATDRIGFGIAAPEQRLHVYSNVTGQSETLRIESRNFSGIDLVGDRSNLSGEPGGAFVRFFQDGGGVGDTIGVQAILGLVQLADEDGSGRSMPLTTANSLLLANRSNGHLHFGAGDAVHMTLRGTGRLGIGTNNPARMLHLRGAEGFARIDRLASTGGTGLLMHQYNDNAGTEEPWKTFGLFSSATAANDGRFVIADLGTSVSGGGTDRLVIDNGGKIGMNIATPTANLHVRSIGGEAMNTLTLSHSTTDKSSQILLSENNVQHGMYLRYHGLSNKLQVLGLNNFSDTDVHMEIDRDTGRLEMFRSVSPGNVIRTVRLQSSDDTDQGSSLELYKGDGSRTIYMNAEEGLGRGADITLYNHSGVGTIQLDADYGDTGIGRVLTQVLEITGGSDFSEQFDIGPARVQPSEKDTESHDEVPPAPGLVVCIDSEHPGKLIVSTAAYDRTVAGVISGAGGVRPGMIMGQSGSVADGEHPVALSGRVYVWCDASSGAIRPGDLLTTSDTPGHAMRVVDHDAARGAIIGKAMTTLEKGETGLVLVLVSLQ